MKLVDLSIKRLERLDPSMPSSLRKIAKEIVRRNLTIPASRFICIRPIIIEKWSEGEWLPSDTGDLKSYASSGIAYLNHHLKQISN